MTLIAIAAFMMLYGALWAMFCVAIWSTRPVPPEPFEAVRDD